MEMTDTGRPHTRPAWASGLLLMADGTVYWGRGAGALCARVGELCFNTSITGYQEIITDPSYAGQIITFTFPHIGIVGSNTEDVESAVPHASGCVISADITAPSNWRSAQHLDKWLAARKIPAVTGLDTRRLTTHLREHGACGAVIDHFGTREPDLAGLETMLHAWPGIMGADLATMVTAGSAYDWSETRWAAGSTTTEAGFGSSTSDGNRVVVIDYGAKRNILRSLATLGCAVKVLPAESDFATIMAVNPEGVVLSNGPGDPAATGRHAVPTIQALLEARVPIFGICLGHQLLSLALGAKTKKMHFGHRGGNHPVQEIATGKVEITSQNHGFVVDDETLPPNIAVTHRSLFDGTIEGIRVEGEPAFSVQYHPEANPGPEDSHFLFDRFTALIDSPATQ